MRISTISGILVTLFVCAVVHGERWPMGPGDEAQRVGNNYGNIQNYDYGNYFHDGVDILQDAGGEPVYSVCDGFIVEKNDGGALYSGIFVNYSAAGQDLGWAYWHLTHGTIPQDEGDAVSVDDYLGDIATWPVADFHHTHFLRSRHPGNDGEWYDAVDNPIEFMDPPDDDQAPTFYEAQAGQMFSFCINNSDAVVDPGNVNGQVDIIAKIADKIVDTEWEVAPYEIDWWVEDDTGTVVVPTKLFITFTGELPPKYELVDVVYKDSGIWDSRGDYDHRDYYYIVSNTDGDGALEATDSLYAFYSNSLSNGDYTLYVRAKDFAGNSTTEFMAFTINNTTGENTIDVMQVLDRSGSMGGYTTEDSVERKINVLKYAADEFIQLMKPDIGNRLGIVQFNQDVVPFPPPEPDLKELTSGNVDDFRASVDNIVHGGTTSIGDGLDEAFNQLLGLSDPNPVQFILLISDGKENTPLWISDVQGDLIGQNIAVYALGLGYSYGINEDKLTGLANATGGDYRITSNDLEFRKFFMEVLGDAVNWEVITDPIKVLTAPYDTVPVEVSEYDREVTFTAYWEGEGADNAIDLTLISPDDIEINPKTENTKIRYYEHPKYSFYQLRFPLSGDLAGEHAGTWTMKVTRAPRVDSVRYAVSAFTDSTIEFDVDFDDQRNLTGDGVAITGLLTKGGVPLSGAKIHVDCDVPLVGAGNVLHDGEVGLGQLDPDRTDNDDLVSLIDQKLDMLSERAGRNVLERGEAPFQLYDDGEHGDGNADDGIYANTFEDTKVPGSYTFRFVASDIPIGGDKTTTREWTKSFFNEVGIDPDFSAISVGYVSAADDGSTYAVKVVPKDRFGNYLGPGHKIYATVSYAGARRAVLLDDNIDGTYTKTINLTQREIGTAAPIGVTVDGKEFTEIKPPPILPKKWIASVHGGYAVPLGAFADDFDPGFNVLVDAGYRLKPWLSLVGLFGYNAFSATTTGFDDTYWINLNANVRLHQPITGPWSTYAGAGPGYYIPKAGDNKFGFNVGGGLDYALNQYITLEAAVDYHRIFDGLEVYDPASTDAAQFLHIHVGAVLAF